MVKQKLSGARQKLLSRNEQYRQVQDFFQEPYQTKKMVNFDFPFAIDSLYQNHVSLPQQRQSLSPAILRTKSIVQMRKQQMQLFCAEQETS
mmetsp:Transcript_40969/g.39503  ORF Transcript_40969/g.39503 Transcript_40969/m.39503 type:complete len:91 (-) Transcript_40969:176-448(-)